MRASKDGNDLFGIWHRRKSCQRHIHSLQSRIWASRRPIWTFGNSYSGGAQRLAYPHIPLGCTGKTSGDCRSSILAGYNAMDRQLRAFFWIPGRIFTLLCPHALHLIQPIINLSNQKNSTRDPLPQHHLPHLPGAHPRLLLHPDLRLQLVPLPHLHTFHKRLLR